MGEPLLFGGGSLRGLAVVKRSRSRAIFPPPIPSHSFSGRKPLIIRHNSCEIRVSVTSTELDLNQIPHSAPRNLGRLMSWRLTEDMNSWTTGEWNHTVVVRLTS